MVIRFPCLHSRWNLAFAISLFLLTGFGLTYGQTSCGNGVVEYPSEECDDNNNVTGDGCNNCTVQPHYHCTHNTTQSVCKLVLLDLDKNDHTTLDRSTEYFRESESIFLVNNDSFEFLNHTDWDYLDVVLLEGNDEEEVGIDVTNLRFRPSQQTLVPSLDYTDGLIGKEFNSGFRILIDSSLNENQFMELLEVLYYAPNRQLPYSQPRYVCLVANNSVISTIACVTIYYIGLNLNPPSINYDNASSDVATFTEGDKEAVPIIIGNITVTDEDHPTRYLMQSASARIIGFTEGNAEQLSLQNVSGLNETTYSFNSTTGALVISGAASTETYSNILGKLTYFNNMSQPIHSRQIEITVSDANYTSNPISIQVNVMNVNDVPVVSLTGDDPVVTMLTRNYTEGSGAELIVNDISVIDIDPDAMIIRAIVVLSNSVDGGQEVLNISDTAGLSLNISDPPHSLELYGVANPTNYTRALRKLTYQHLSANPGNPSLQSRYIRFTAEDSNNATSDESVLTLDIIPVNDPPLLELNGGAIEELFSYTEDDPPISIGSNIVLRDVDSNISSVFLLLTNLLNGDQDSIELDINLLLSSSINVNTSSYGTSREIIIYGTAPSSNYMEALRTLTYQNLFTNNSVSDGRRTISISTTDTAGLSSQTNITLMINVSDRNDGPAIDLGDGADQGFTITYTENEPGIAVGFNHLISITDEEGDPIAGMVIELVATNGNLDEGDQLLVMPSTLIEFYTNPNSVITKTLINASSLSSNEAYMDILRSLIFVNTDDEPTLYNMNGSKLYREIVITIIDSANNSGINAVRVNVVITPINDKTPRIIINSFPVCTQDSRHSVQRRSTTTRTHRRKRSSRTSSLTGNSELIAAPRVIGIYPHFTEMENRTCLFQLVVNFNADTNIPIVQISQEIDSLLTFAPASLARTPHRGYWKDYRTLVILFDECITWDRLQDHRKPLYVVFYGPEGPCSWDSLCDKGVCYYNSTGCPVVGYHRVNMSDGSEGDTPTPEPTDDCTTQSGPSRTIVFVLCLLMIVAVATVMGHQCRKKRKQKRFIVESKVYEEKKTTPPVQCHVIDIKVPRMTCPSKSSEDKTLLIPKEVSPPLLPVEKCTVSVTESGNLDTKERAKMDGHKERSIVNTIGAQENLSIARNDDYRKPNTAGVCAPGRVQDIGVARKTNCSISAREQSTSHTTPRSNTKNSQTLH